MEDRQFSTGSIEAPDAFDKHLDQLGFYRKHTARDSTCLFRVISEQMYDAQIYHSDIRDFCVRYMAWNQSTYEKIIVTDLTYDEYLAKLSKTRTFGSLAELHALAYRYQRNVFLFEAYSLGDYYVYEKEFKDTFLIFYTPPKHFDTVFPKSFITSVAFCQSLTYEILYSHVFKLPDVIYAVERMLRDPKEGTHISQIEVSPYDECQEALTLSDGRYFILDHADETECILKNYLFCHFHNKQFEKMIAQQDHSDMQQDDPDAWALSEHAWASSLPRRNVSCVRQLLDENIKPFSYKVAKALDTHIYRNIEFDVWSEARRNSRFKQWSQGDSLQVGIKCIVDNIDENQKSYYCHIQEMRPQKNSCVVFVETLGENRIVPYSAIKTIPSVSWMVPNYQSRYRSEKKRRRNCHSNEPCKSDSYKCSKLDVEDAFHDIHYFTRTLHIPQQYCEYITHPQYATNRYSKNERDERDTVGGNNNQPNNKNLPPKKPNQGGEKAMKGENVKNAPAKRSGTTVEAKSAKTEMLNVEFEPHVHYGNQHGNMGYVDTSNPVPFSHMDRPEMDGSTTVQSYAGHSHSLSLQSMVNREMLRTVYPVNLNAQPSMYADGADLQGMDYPTLRFFYNLGHEYMRYMHYRFPHTAVTAMFQGITNDSFSTRSHRFTGGYHDNFQDMGELANDFSRAVSFGRDQHANKPNDSQNQYRRTFNSNTVNGPKKNAKNYRSDYKGKRQFGESEASSKHQQPNYNKATTNYPDAAPVAEPNTRTAEHEQATPLMQAPQQMYSYHDAGDPGNVYGAPVGYGMYPHVNDNFSTYPVTVPGGMMFSDPLNVEGDLTQTYPYYNPHGTYYYSTPMPPFPMGQPQGPWYPQSMLPIHSNMQVPLQTSGSTAAPPPSAQSYGNYIVADAENAAPFTQNEPQ